MKGLRIILGAFLTIAAADAGSVRLLDGTLVEGKIILLDIHTLKVSSDTGVIFLPIASLGQPEIEKFTGGIDRGRDARFWFERREVLQRLEKSGPLPPELRREQGEVFRRLDLIRDYAWSRKMANKAETESRLAAIEEVWKQRKQIERESARATVIRNRKKIIRLGQTIAAWEAGAQDLAVKMGRMNPGGPNRSMAGIQLSSLQREIEKVRQEREEVEAASARLVKRWDFTEAELTP